MAEIISNRTTKKKPIIKTETPETQTLKVRPKSNIEVPVTNTLKVPKVERPEPVTVSPFSNPFASPAFASPFDTPVNVDAEAISTADPDNDAKYKKWAKELQVSAQEVMDNPKKYEDEIKVKGIADYFTTDEIFESVIGNDSEAQATVADDIEPISEVSEVIRDVVKKKNYEENDIAENWQATRLWMTMYDKQPAMKKLSNSFVGSTYELLGNTLKTASESMIKEDTQEVHPYGMPRELGYALSGITGKNLEEAGIWAFEAAQDYENEYRKFLPSPYLHGLYNRISANQGAGGGFISSLLMGVNWSWNRKFELLNLGASMMPATLATVAMGVAGGKVGGLFMAGKPLLNIGTKIIGSTTGSSVGVYGIESVQAIDEVLSNKGIDITRLTPEGWIRFASSPENQREIRRVGQARGLGTALGEAGGRAAMYALRLPKNIGSFAIPKAIRNPFNVAMQFGSQSITEGAGAALADQWAYGRINHANVALEMIGTIPLTSVELLAYRPGHLMDTFYDLRDLKRSELANLDGQEKALEEFPQRLQTVIQKYESTKLSERDPQLAKVLVAEEFQDFKRVFFDGRALIGATDEELGILELTRAQVNGASEKQGDLAVALADIVQNPEMLQVLEKFRKSYKRGLGGRSLDDIDLRRKTINPKIWSGLVTDLPSNDKIVQQETIDDIYAFIATERHNSGQVVEKADKDAKIATNKILKAWQTGREGSQSLSHFFELWGMRTIGESAPDQNTLQEAARKREQIEQQNKVLIDFAEFAKHYSEPDLRTQEEIAQDQKVSRYRNIRTVKDMRAFVKDYELPRPMYYWRFNKAQLQMMLEEYMGVLPEVVAHEYNLPADPNLLPLQTIINEKLTQLRNPDEYVRQLDEHLRLYRDISQDILRSPPEIQALLKAYSSLGVDPRDRFGFIQGKLAATIKQMIADKDKELADPSFIENFIPAAKTIQGSESAELDEEAVSQFPEDIEPAVQQQEDESLIEELASYQSDELANRADNLAQSYLQQEREFERMFDGTVATRDGTRFGDLLLFDQVAPDVFTYSGQENPGGTYIKVTRPDVRRPGDIISIDGQQVVVRDLFSPGNEVLVQRFRELLNLRGFDGLRVQFDDAIGFITAPSLDLLQGVDVDQGLFRVRAGERPTIILYDTADASTFYHEMAHYFFWLYGELAARGQLNPEIQESLELGLGKPLNLATDRDQEDFAEGYELFLRRGRVPEGVDEDLERAYQEITGELQSIYEREQDIFRRGRRPSAEVLDVLQRIMFASDASAAATQERARVRLYSDPEKAGQSSASFREGQRQGVKAARRAQAESVASFLREGEHDKEVRRNSWNSIVQQELEAMGKEKLYRAIKALLDPRGPKFRESVLEEYPKIPVAMTSPTGETADMVAERFQYSSGQTLLAEISEEARYDRVAEQWVISLKAIAEERALERINRIQGTEPDLQGLQEIVRFATGASEQAPVMSRELARTLMIIAGAPNSEEGRYLKAAQREAELYRANAEKEMIKTRLGNIREELTQLLNAVERLERESNLAFSEERYVEAAELKRQELELHQKARVLQEMNTKLSEQEAQVEPLKRAKVPFDHDPGHSEPIKDLMRAGGLMKDKEVSNQRINDVQQFVNDQREEGETMDIPTSVFTKVSPTEGTIQQRLDLLKAIRKLSRSSRNKLKKGEVDKDQNLNALGDFIKGGRKFKWGTWVPSAIREIDISLLKLNTMAELMDRGEKNGRVKRAIYDPLQEARGRHGQETKEFDQKYKELGIEKLGKDNNQFLSGKHTIDGANYKGTDLVTLAELYYSEGGLDMLKKDSKRWKGLSKDGWINEAHLRNVIDYLPSELAPLMDARQQLQTYVEDKALSFLQRQDGERPEGVVRKTARIGNMDVLMGHAFLVPDKQVNQIYELQAIGRAKDYDAGRYLQQMTRLGSLAAANRMKGLSPSFSTADMFLGMQDAIHDMSWRPALNNFSRIMKNSKVRSAMEEKGGIETLNGFDRYLTILKAGHLRPGPGWESILRMARIGYSSAALGHSLRTASLQPPGISVSVARVGLPGILSALVHPARSLKLAYETSSWYRNVRMDTSQREISEINQYWDPNQGWAKKTWKKWIHFGFTMIKWIDYFITGITLAASYNKGIAQGLSKTQALRRGEEDAKLTQGSALPEDTALFLQSGEGHRIVSMFQTFFNSLHNMLYLAYFNTKWAIQDGKFTKAGLHAVNQYWWLVALPVLYHTILTGERPEEDDNPYVWWTLTFLKETAAGCHC